MWIGIWWIFRLQCSINHHARIADDNPRLSVKHPIGNSLSRHKQSFLLASGESVVVFLCPFVSDFPSWHLCKSPHSKIRTPDETKVHQLMV
jgi:hypothetical protein